MEIKSKNQTEKIDYFQVLKFFRDEKISYAIDNHILSLTDMVEVYPVSNTYEIRKFDLKKGKQVVEKKDSKMRTTLDSFNYKEYIEFLTNLKIRYEEHKYMEFSMSDTIYFEPFIKKIKGRFFLDEYGKPCYQIY